MNDIKAPKMLGADTEEVVETPAGQPSDPASFAEAVQDVGEGSMLGYRLHQQAVLSDFGLGALKTRDVDRLLLAGVTAAADGMRASLGKVLEHRPDRGDLLFRSGIGWRAGVIGNVSLPADEGSPAGFAFLNGSPVISNHLEREKRFRTPRVMAEHGVRRAINVLISRGNGPWGILEVDSSNAGEFEAADLAFLQGLANFLGVALDRLFAEEQLVDALDHQKLLVKEASHRVKNSLAMLSGLMRMQARSVKEASAADALEEASDRIIAVARTHDQIWRQDSSERIDLAELLSDLCHALNAQWPHIEFQCHVASHIVAADQAASFALLVTELATNAAKHGYDERGGEVRVSLTSDDGDWELSVANEGEGLPPGFDLQATCNESLGMKLISTLAKSVGGFVRVETESGTTFIINGS